MPSMMSHAAVELRVKNDFCLEETVFIKVVRNKALPTSHPFLVLMYFLPWFCHVTGSSC